MRALINPHINSPSCRPRYCLNRANSTRARIRNDRVRPRRTMQMIYDYATTRASSLCAGPKLDPMFPRRSRASSGGPRGARITGTTESFDLSVLSARRYRASEISDNYSSEEPAKRRDAERLRCPVPGASPRDGVAARKTKPPRTRTARRPLGRRAQRRCTVLRVSS